MIKFIPYNRHWIDRDDIKAVINVLKSDWITQGPAIEKFEKALTDYCGAKYAVVFNSGTSALHGAYFAAGLRGDDEFITTPNTFAATSNAGLYLNAKPVFTDIEEDTGNIDVSKIEEKITRKTRLVVTVHYAGHPVDLIKVYELAKKYRIPVIEDACHALGAKYKNIKIGNCKYSDMTVLSFHPVKHITTGEGGAVLTNNEVYHKKLLIFRTHGITKKDFVNTSDGEWYYEMQYLGYNYRMTDIQAALGISQLKKLDSFVARIREIAVKYDEAFAGNPYFDIPAEKDYAFSSYHLYPIRLKTKYRKKRKDIFKNLREAGIGVQIHYIPVYFHPYYKKLGYRKGLCPFAEDFYQREISIPLYPAMRDKDVIYVIKTTLGLFKKLSQEESKL